MKVHYSQYLKRTIPVVSAALLSACATGHIDPSDRDTTGAYDGVWVATVGLPKAKRVPMPGNFTMHCKWEPYEFRLPVNGGRVQLRGIDAESVVSTAGNFRFDRRTGSVKMHGGVISGSANEVIGIYTGNLAGEEPRGEFVQNIPALGGKACRADILFQREVG